MWKIFKSKEEKIKEKELNIQQDFNNFVQKNEEYFNSYAFNGKDIIIYRKPFVKDNKIMMSFITINTAKGYEQFAELCFLELKYGDDFLKHHRGKYLNLKHQMETLGLKISKIEEE